ncbi:MAG: universal stress protein [Nitriliruptoraceae bacterium]
MSRIVVGIDSSPHARRALEWALDEARIRGATLEMVHAYPTPEVTAMPAIVTLPSDAELRAAGAETLQAVLDDVGGPGDVEVVLRTEPGGAAWVLTSVAEGADMLVLGARGLGGFRGLLLGSVSQQSVVHSPCPVVIIPPSKDD